MFKSGVYAILCSATGKAYIGSSSNVTKRKGVHFRDLKKNRHHSPKLQNAFNKYGADTFVFEYIQECEKEKLIDNEQFFIHFYDSFRNGYNSRPRAENHTGYKMTPEQALKITGPNNACFGRKHTDDERNLMRINHWSKRKKSPRLGIPRSEETKMRIREKRATRIDFCLISPNNTIVKGSNLTQFCKEENLNVSSVINVLNNKSYFHKQWVKAPLNLGILSKDEIALYAEEQRSMPKKLNRYKHHKDYISAKPSQTKDNRTLDESKV